MGHKYGSILETVGNTPVVRINKLAPPDVNLYVKVEAFNPLGSVKDRLALGVIEDAERRGKLKPGQTVVEATSGNTGIGLAMVCAAKGYPLVVTMAESFSIERRKLMRFLGAKVIITPASARAVGMVEKTVELAKKHGWFYTRQFENEANAAMHSRTTAKEILRDFKGERLDYWVTGFRNRRHAEGCFAGAGQEAAGDKDRGLRAGGRAYAFKRSGAAAEAGRLGKGAARLVETAPDAGMEPGLYRQAGRRRGEHEGHQPGADHCKRRCPEVQQGPGEEGRNLCRDFVGRDVCRRAARGGGGSEGIDDPVHAARYRRAVLEHAAVRGCFRRHDRGRAGDCALHAGLLVAAGAVEHFTN